MIHPFPPIEERGPLPLEHFPTRMQAFVFRNWGMVEPSVLASILGCSTDSVRELAVNMGLPADPCGDYEAWRTKGYITIIRANWHLCTYSQIAGLLGWSEEKLAFILREDDFLSHKLGHFKPAVEPVAYEKLDAASIAETARLRERIRALYASLPAPTAKPLDFVPMFSEAVRDPMPGKTDRFEYRIIYSYCALYGDTFADPALLEASFPEELLAAYQSLGINGIWTQAVLYTLTPNPFEPSLSEGYESRLAGMRALVERLARYGIKLFLYLNEPRAMPPEFFEGREQLRGTVHAQTGYGSLCVSVPEVREYLRASSEYLCRAVPGLGGYLTITASENQTNCYSHAIEGNCTCPRCRERRPSDVIADVNRALYEGAAAVNPDFRMLAWNWAWNGRQENMIADTVKKMPEGVALMCVSEEAVTKIVGGVETSVRDYSISVEGPGELAKNAWREAHRLGHPTYAKLQLGVTWEMACIPCIPAFDKIYRHLSGVCEAGVNGIMLGWTLGGFPSPTLRLAQGFYESGGIPEKEKLYARMFPDADPDTLAIAFTALSEAFDEYPFHIMSAYNGPQQMGCANLLWGEPTGWKSTMVCYPYDDLDGWRSVYPREVYLSQLEKLASGWHQGLALLEAAAAKSADPTLHSLVRWTKAADCQFGSMVNQCRFVMAREAGGDLSPIIDDEIRLARELMLLCGEDPTIGYESSNHYFFTRMSLAEKILCCEKLKENHK